MRIGAQVAGDTFALSHTSIVSFPLSIMRSLLLIIGFLSFTGTAFAQNTAFSQQPFTDVPINHPNYQAIEYLRSQNIVRGYLDGTFKPNTVINRAEFVEFIINPFILDTNGMGTCVKANTPSTSSRVFFSDVAKGTWYAENICFAKMKDLVNGYPDGTFRPADSISFVEAAKIISNVFGLNVGAYQTGEFWYRPYVQSLSDLHAIPTNITRINQALSRADMAQIVYRLKVDSTEKPHMVFNQTRNTLTQRGTTSPVVNVPSPPPAPAQTPSIPDYYRSQTGRRAIAEPTRGTYTTTNVEVSTFASEQLATRNVLQYLGRIGFDTDGKNPTLIDYQLIHSGVAFQELTSHVCFEPSGTEVAACQKRFGMFYNLKDSILDGSLLAVLSADNPEMSDKVVQLYQSMVAEITRNDTSVSVTQSARTASLMRARMLEVWEACKAQTSSISAANSCYIRNSRLYLDYDVLTR